MKTWIFICMSIAMLLWFLSTLRRKPSQKKGCIDAIIPAYNEGPCLAQSLDNLLRTTFTGIFLRDGNKAVAPFAFDFRHDRFGIVRGAVVNANYPAKIRVTQ